MRKSIANCEIRLRTAKTEFLLRDSFAGGESRIPAAKSVCELRKSNSNCEIRLRTAKAEFQLRNSFADCESRIPTARSVCQMRKRIANSEIRFPERAPWHKEPPPLSRERRLEQDSTAICVTESLQSV